MDWVQASRDEACGATREGTAPSPKALGVGALGGTAANDKLNCLTIKMYFNYINTSIKADSSYTFY